MSDMDQILSSMTRRMNEQLDNALRDAMLGGTGYYGTNTTANTTTPPPTLTVNEILETARRIRRIPMPPEIRVSEHAVQKQQTRVYPRRKAKNESHVRRMNKKWLRRYGYSLKPAAYVMDTSMLGGRGKIMLVHPSLYRIAKMSLGIG